MVTFSLWMAVFATIHQASSAPTLEDKPKAGSEVSVNELDEQPLWGRRSVEARVPIWGIDITDKRWGREVKDSEPIWGVKEDNKRWGREVRQPVWGVKEDNNKRWGREAGGPVWGVKEDNNKRWGREAGEPVWGINEHHKNPEWGR